MNPMMSSVVQIAKPKPQDLEEEPQSASQMAVTDLESIFNDVSLEDSVTENETFDHAANHEHRSDNALEQNSRESTRKALTGRETHNLGPSSNEPLQFDDDNVDVIEYDSDLDWNNQPFDYNVPMDRPFIHEEYKFDAEGSNPSALSFDPQELVNNAVAGASDIQRRLSQTVDAAAPPIGRAARTGRGMAVSFGEFLSAKIKGKGKELADAGMEFARARWARSSTAMKGSTQPNQVADDQEHHRVNDG
ncbi:hypothetical protein K4F52_003944 [Lecanicillium sp. MT-2017a]|nr:hypothetical protein K4F52_003944 [Lecanicillium sp. MT-2017a]